MIKVSSFGKFLDQPLLTAKLDKKVPAILTVASSAIVVNELKNTPPEDRKKTGVKLAVILGVTLLSAVQAPKIAAYMTGRKMPKSFNELKENNVKIVNEIFKENKLSENIKVILNKAKEKVLSVKEVDTLSKNLDITSFEKLIPPPENITSKDIFKEIGWLSVYGAIPVMGGILGGIAADKLTEKSWKNGISDKVKEGVYQYLANIFMCNIGAGAALGILENMNIKSKAARCVGMIGGIILTGVIGGSAIANYISRKLINPMMEHNKKSEVRTPELLDLGLHIDDIATVSLLSGLKWIEPSLPILYSISGYRAGIGYRNDNKHMYSKVGNKQEFLCDKC